MSLARRLSVALELLHLAGRRWLWPAALAGALLLALSACLPGPGGSLALSLDADVVQAVRGTSGQVEVTLTRTGEATAPVELSVSGLPLEVTAEFAPATLTGDTLTSVLTLSVDAATAAETIDVTVTASGGGLSATGDLTLEVTSLTVRGRVIGTVYDLPFVGVAVGSQGVVDVTDDDGRFELSGLSVPYELRVWDKPERWLHIYAGLTADELLVVPGVGPGPRTFRQAQVTGQLTGDSVPLPRDSVVLVCAEGEDGAAEGCVRVQPPRDTYSLNVSWSNDVSREIRPHALQVEYDSGGFPVAYPGYTRVPLTLTDAVDQSVDLDLGRSLKTRSVAVDLDSPTYINASLAGVQVGPDLLIRVLRLDSPDTNYDVVMPVIEGSSYSFGVYAAQGIGWQVGVTDRSAVVLLPTRPQLLAPAEGADGITVGSEFSASSFESGLKRFVWWEPAFGGLNVTLTTMDSTVTLPDIAANGLSWPSNSSLEWYVAALGGLTPEYGIRAYGYWYGFSHFYALPDGTRAIQGSGKTSSSLGRAFTAAP